MNQFIIDDIKWQSIVKFVIIPFGLDLVGERIISMLQQMIHCTYTSWKYS